MAEPVASIYVAAPVVNVRSDKIACVELCCERFRYVFQDYLALSIFILKNLALLSVASQPAKNADTAST